MIGPRALRGLAACLAGTAIAASCASEPPEVDEKRCRATPFAAPFASVDPCSGEAVLTVVVQTIFTYTPGAEADPRAAFRAAAPLMQPSFGTRTEPSATALLPISVSTWQRWRNEAITVRTAVHVRADDHPADSPTTVHRVLSVELQPSDSHPIQAAVYATARRTDLTQPWLLSAIGVAG